MKRDFDADVIVIGGGASGMMAAIIAARDGKEVLILEKNKVLGNKLSITGGGRCNITNTNPDEKKMLSNYGEYAKYLHSAFSVFGVKDTILFFNSIGINIITEARHRAFPSTQSAKDVTAALRKEIKKLGIKVRTGTIVIDIKIKSGKITEIITKDETYTAKSFILSTGGMSHPETGSTGDGFNFLKSFGHEVYDPKPSIVPLRTKEKWSHNLSGMSVENAKIIFYTDGKKSFLKQGKILFTHFGLSGPMILNLSTKVSDLIHSGTVTAKINFFPELSEGELDKKILKLFDKNKNKDIKNIIGELIQDKIGLELLEKVGVDIKTKVHSITKENRKNFRIFLQEAPITIDGLMGYDRAVIADGGINMKEIDTKTMLSNKIKNLFITGDLLNINRPSGGFSLQLCWTTGYIAGKNC